MKQASTTDRTEYILYDVVNGSRSKPIAKLEYSQNQGSTFSEFTDIKNMSFGSTNVNKQYSKFILVPPANTFSTSFDNKSEKYSPGGGGAFADILKRNLLLKPSFGYQMNDPDETTSNILVTSSLLTYHTQTGGSVIKSNVASEVSFTALNGITDDWTFYDGQNYDSTTYNPEGYWLSTITEYADLWGSLALTKLTMDSTSDKIYVYYRASDVKANLEDDVTAFTLLSELSSGTNELLLPDITERFFQFAIVFDTGTWSLGEVSNMKITYISNYEYFQAGQFLVDRASFNSRFGDYQASADARDKLKKAIETKVTLPSYTSSTDLAEILRDAADRANIPHNSGTELIADTGYTVTIADDDNFKNVQANDVFNEVMTYLNWKNSNYRLELNIDGFLQLVIKASTTVTADWQLDYRWNTLSLSKDYRSDNFTQRITMLAKSHTVDTETQLATQTYLATQSSVDLTWSNKAIYKRIEVTVNSGDGVFSLEATENQKITLSITGTTINVTVTVYGAELQTSPPFIGESIYYDNAQYSDGVTHQIVNRLIQSDNEARDISKSLTDIYGNPEFVVTATLPYNPLLELGDRLLVWEKYSNTTTVFRLDSINVNYSAEGASMYMTLGLTDLGSEQTNFNWDRHNVINGGARTGVDDLKWDTGMIWDQGLGAQATEDTTDYSYLKEVRFG
jgi:hypothetical protein